MHNNSERSNIFSISQLCANESWWKMHEECVTATGLFRLKFIAINIYLVEIYKEMHLHNNCAHPVDSFRFTEQVTSKRLSLVSSYYSAVFLSFFFFLLLLRLYWAQSESSIKHSGVLHSMGLVWVGDRGTCPPMFLGVGDKRHFVPLLFYRARFFYLVPR